MEGWVLLLLPRVNEAADLQHCQRLHELELGGGRGLDLVLELQIRAAAQVPPLHDRHRGTKGGSLDDG